MTDDTSRSSQYEAELKLLREWMPSAVKANERYFDLLTQGMPFLDEHLLHERETDTLHVLKDFLLRLGMLKNGLLSLGEEAQYYVMCILYRSYLEHWLKGTYAWCRYTKEGNDAVGREYGHLLTIGEEVQYGHALRHSSKIMESGNYDVDPWSIVLGHTDDVKNASRKSVEIAVKNFDYKNILRYLRTNQAPGFDWIPAIVSDYSELSSFVHGGPRSMRQFAKLAHIDECRRMITFAINMTAIYTYSVFALPLRTMGDEDEKKHELLTVLSELNKIRI